jgi:hypothetical protein
MGAAILRKSVNGRMLIDELSESCTGKDKARSLSICVDAKIQQPEGLYRLLVKMVDGSEME